MKNNFSYSLIVIDKACQSDNFSSLSTLSWRPIIFSILIITPADWAFWPAILQLILYLICGHFSKSDSPKVHLISLRQLSHDKCRSWVCLFCCERAKRSINRSEISVFKQHVSPTYDLDNVRLLNGIYTTFS